MSQYVEVKFDTAELERAFKELADNAKAIPYSNIGEIVMSRMDDLIQSEGNGKWAPFSPVTLKVHPSRIGGKLLQDNTELASLQIRTRHRWVDIISPAPYAVYQALGTNVTRGLVESPNGIPARDITDIDMEDTLDEVARYILDEIVMR